MSKVKARPNARNISTQHLATLLDRVVKDLAKRAQNLATSKNVATKIWPFSNLIQHHPTSCNMWLQGGQMRVIRCAQQCCKMLRWNVAYVWPGLNPGLHWVCFTALCDWSRKLAPPSQPIRYKTIQLPIATWLLAFTRAWGRLHAFTLTSHWLLVIFPFVLIIRSGDYFGFGFTAINRKAHSSINPIKKRQTMHKQGDKKKPTCKHLTMKWSQTLWWNRESYPRPSDCEGRRTTNTMNRERHYLQQTEEGRRLQPCCRL